MTSQSRAIRYQSIFFEICDIRAFVFLNCEITCVLTDIQASIYDRKTAAQPFETIDKILRCLSLVLLKDRDAPIWRKRELTHLRRSGTDNSKAKYSGNWPEQSKS